MKHRRTEWLQQYINPTESVVELTSLISRCEPTGVNPITSL